MLLLLLEAVSQYIPQVGDWVCIKDRPSSILSYFYFVLSTFICFLHHNPFCQDFRFLILSSTFSTTPNFSHIDISFIGLQAVCFSPTTFWNEHDAHVLDYFSSQCTVLSTSCSEINSCYISIFVLYIQVSWLPWEPAYDLHLYPSTIFVQILNGFSSLWLSIWFSVNSYCFSSFSAPQTFLCHFCYLPPLHFLDLSDLDWFWPVLEFTL